MIRLQPETTIGNGARYSDLGIVSIEVPALDFMAAITADLPTTNSLGYDPKMADGSRIWHNYAARAIRAGELALGNVPRWVETDMRIQAWLHATVARGLQAKDI